MKRAINPPLDVKTATPATADDVMIPTEIKADGDREAAAWAAIDQIIEKTDYDKSIDRQVLLNLGVETIDVVAQAMRPGEKEPLWKFTVPEALALIERSSRELSEFVQTSVPLSNRLTIKQLIIVYQWRGVIRVAKRAYDLWRIIRLANPAAALSGEARDRMSAEMINNVRNEVIRKMVQQYIRIVGQAAIDIYSGRLKPDGVRSATA